jgi:NADPH-dependent glutamate synthase beta subunit-like oxidoreductase/Pyruvate/2-oxoacid:ferredoxin oxidoreductase delta subunit
MMEQPIVFKQLADYPYKSISLGSTRVNLTGLWRYWRPYYQTKRSPCDAHCPVGNNAVGFVQAAAQADWTEAARILREENPLAAVTGRVCYHPCEGQCNRREYDSAVAIQAIERVIADVSVEVPTFPLPDRPRSAVAVGSGPAGLTFVHYLSALGHKVTLLEARQDLGGLLRYGIPAYRLPKDVLDKEIERLLANRIEIQRGCQVGRDVSLDELKQSYDAVFLAPGASRRIAMGISGEDVNGVISGVEFLRRVHDGEIKQLTGRVAVIGGGNSAVDAARTLLRLGAAVTIVYRRSRQEMPAYAEEVDAAEAEGVRFEMLASPIQVLVRDSRVVGLRVQRNRLGEPGPDGRRRPVAVPGTEESWPFDLVISAVGEAADPDLAPQLAWGSGGVATDELGHTGYGTVWAAGDFTDMPRTVADAIGQGKRAALLLDAQWRGLDSEEVLTRIRVGGEGAVSAAKYRQLLRGEPSSRLEEVVGYDLLNPDFFEPAARVRLPRVAASEARTSFVEGTDSLMPAQATREAVRCFSCGLCDECDNCWLYCPDLCISRQAGQYEIDYNYCKGCRVCEAVCPRGVISVVEEGKWNN